jgi:NAD-reducing hydrogenase small subunit
MAENGKPTVASEWLTGCAGCHMSLLDIDERIIDIVTAVTLWSTPITDLKHPPEEGVTVGILEGGINNSTTEEVAKMMRARSKILIALGDCAVFGGVPSMRNACGIQEALQRAYVESESTVDGQIPSHPDIAVMQETRPVDAVVPVDIYLPGCAPSADAIFYVLAELANGRMPEVKGKFLDWH